MVNPKEIISSLEEECNQFEQEIDKQLLAKKAYAGDIISVYPPSKCTSRHCEVLIKRYKMNGWAEVKKVGDRDGDFLQFTMPNS